ncbi:MAG: recombinase family protein [Cyanophyceae cyanobacterium]
MVLLLSVWITGATRTGKTSRLVQEFRRWVKGSRSKHPAKQMTAAVLVLAANDECRQNLADRLSTAIEGSYPAISKTPLGFISDEVILFWPLLFNKLNLKAQFPVRLRPETEQELATQLWREPLEQLQLTDIPQYRLVRRLLDLFQLAGASGIEAEQIGTILEQGLDEERSPAVALDEEALLRSWRQWCLHRGLLTYGLMYELYWRYLLPDPTYQQHLSHRYRAVFADDVDDYPAIAKDLFDFLLDQKAWGVFTYNPNSQVRLGLGADPEYLASLASRCQQITLSLEKDDLPQTAVALVTEPILVSLPASVQSIQTISRAELLRETAATIAHGVTTGAVEPSEIVIIAPGLDEIARYTLIEILSGHGIPVEPLNEQRPLASSPLIRALLTLLSLVYPGLGRLVDRDAVAEMLVMLSQDNDAEPGRLAPRIDPVRAGLLADYCYQVDPEQPRLLAVEAFPRWDRLGHRATAAYQEIVEWLKWAKALPKPTSAIALLNQASERFLSSYCAYDQLSALRELMETAQHYWEVDRRLRQNEPSFQSATATVAQFVQLLRRGTITANPRPTRSFGDQGAVMMATIFQYRSRRSAHRWQFWLDASSSLWEKGGAATLFAAPLFLRGWSGHRWTSEEQLEADQQRLQRILKDVLGRVEERVFLCHSDLGVNGTEQTGPLLPLVHASRPLVPAGGGRETVAPQREKGKGERERRY